MEEKDRRHLQWLYDRMRLVHKEDANTDYMIKFLQIINKKDDPGYPGGLTLTQNHLAKGSCFWGHKWTIWEQQNIKMKLRDDPKTEFFELKQHRYCVRCNKMQVQTVD